jgi:hypothetical protein
VGKNNKPEPIDDKTLGKKCIKYFKAYLELV